MQVFCDEPAYVTLVANVLKGTLMQGGMVLIYKYWIVNAPNVERPISNAKKYVKI